MTKRGLFLKVAEKAQNANDGNEIVFEGGCGKESQGEIVFGSLCANSIYLFDCCLGVVVKPLSMALIVLGGLAPTTIYHIDCSGGFGPNHYLLHLL